MGRAGVLALACLILALVLGLIRAQRDMSKEVDDAWAVAAMAALLADPGSRSDAQTLSELRQLQPEAGAHHLHLEVRDAAGTLLLPPPPPAPAFAALSRLHALVFTPPASRSIEWQLPRADGSPWHLRLVASAERERGEALSDLAETFVLLLLVCLGMLALMRWSLVRSLAPLQPVLEAIESLEQGESGAIQRLPLPMPVRELDAVTRALQRLAHSLAAAEDARGALAQQVFSLQEEERARLARELHDEFGQRLTALRADAAWLQRQLQHEPRLLEVVSGMAEQCRLIHEDTRALLERLRPLGHEGLGLDHANAELPAAQLQQMLARLVADFSGRALEVRFDWQEPAPQSAGLLPAVLVLALYRISQEALTNVARHARARVARLRIVFEQDTRGRATALLWSIEDDGVGLAAGGAGAAGPGTGLAGMRERLLALGSELVVAAGRSGRGTRLATRVLLAAAP